MEHAVRVPAQVGRVDSIEPRQAYRRQIESKSRFRFEPAALHERNKYRDSATVLVSDVRTVTVPAIGYVLRVSMCYVTRLPPPLLCFAAVTTSSVY